MSYHSQGRVEMTNLTKGRKVLKTNEQIRQEFAEQGRTLSDFALANGFNSQNVIDTLRISDPSRIRRGRRYEIAVALGMIEGKPACRNQASASAAKQSSASRG